MNVLCCGDQHISNHRPKNRKDDYAKTILNKFKQELAIAEEEDCMVMVLPGDVFDSYKENHKITQDIIYAIKQHPRIRVIGVAGQHDQQFHNSDLSGTALETLIAAGVFTILGDVPLLIGNCNFYGASWKSDVPKIVDNGLVNVLVIHKMIIDDKLWAAQEGHTWANHFLIKNRFDLVISGDNHQQFTVSKGGQHLVNMGSMMRSTIAQVNHHPAVVIYDSCKQEIDIIDLDVRPIDEVMQVDKAEKEKERNAQLDAFVATVRGDDVPEGQVIKLSFVDALEKEIKDKNIEDSVADIIYEAVEE